MIPAGAMVWCFWALIGSTCIRQGWTAGAVVAFLLAIVSLHIGGVRAVR